MKLRDGSGTDDLTLGLQLSTQQRSYVHSDGGRAGGKGVSVAVHGIYIYIMYMCVAIYNNSVLTMPPSTGRPMLVTTRVENVSGATFTLSCDVVGVRLPVRTH